MIGKHAGVVVVLLALAADAWGQRLAPEVVVSNPQVFEVAITTKFVAPENGEKLSELRVWHALPTARPWDGLDRTMGASSITVEPETGHVQHLSSNESQNVLWELRGGLEPGTKFEFTSRFRVRSADRDYDVKRSIAQWSDYYQTIGADAPIIEEKLDSIVDAIKKSHPPAEAALEFCKWVAANLTYDASVTYDPRDLGSTLKNRRGHRGHQARVFEAMCARAGLPTRPVVGLNLRVPDGLGDLHKIRPDYENQHTWAQVYLPGSGWIEIDPGMGAKAYFIPAQLIQNNADFQNYVVWVRDPETWKLVEWVVRDGQWTSAYSIENRRSFRRIESK